MRIESPRMVRVLGLTIGVGFWAVVPLSAQVELAPPDAEFSEGFGRLQGVRELPDGRVLIADRLGKLVALVDFNSDGMEQIGRVGGGPQEYGMPAGLVPLPGDRSLLLDLGRMRLLEIEADGSLGDSYSAMRSDAHSGTMVLPSGADQNGWVYFEPRSQDRSEVGYVLRWRPGTDVIEEVATYRKAPPRAPRVGAPSPFSLTDAWSVHPSGAVAIAIADGYRVDWVNDGVRTTGPVQPFDPVRVTDADRDAFRERMGQSAVAIDVGNESRPTGAASVSRADLEQAFPDESFPQFKAPFFPRGVQVTPWGDAWVRREVRAGAPPLYDIFNRAGERIRQVQLDQGARLIGFGESTIYTVRTDEFGLEYLQRRPR